METPAGGGQGEPDQAVAGRVEAGGEGLAGPGLGGREAPDGRALPLLHIHPAAYELVEQGAGPLGSGLGVGLGQALEQGDRLGAGQGHRIEREDEDRIEGRREAREAARAHPPVGAQVSEDLKEA